VEPAAAAAGTGFDCRAGQPPGPASHFAEEPAAEPAAFFFQMAPEPQSGTARILVAMRLTLAGERFRIGVVAAIRTQRRLFVGALQRRANDGGKVTTRHGPRQPSAAERAAPAISFPALFVMRGKAPVAAGDAVVLRYW